MAKLTDLPAELFDKICWNISCTDFENLQQVSRKVKTRSDIYIKEHRRLQKIHTRYIKRDTSVDHIYPGSTSLVELLRDAVSVPRDATYIRFLSINDSYCYHLDFTRQISELVSIEISLATQLASDVSRDLQYPGESDLGEWTENFRREGETHVIGMLLMVLPGLSKIHLTNIRSRTDSLIQAVIHVVKNPTSGMLSQLATVRLSFEDYAASLGLVLAFASLPSVKNIRANSVGGAQSINQYDIKRAEGLVPLSSKVTNLSLRESLIPSSVLLQVLSGCHSLQKLEYSADSFRYDDVAHSTGCAELWQTTGPPRCGGTMERILLWECESDHVYDLSDLELQAPKANARFSDDLDFLHCFHSVKELGIEFRYILCSTDDTSEAKTQPRMTAMFPPSLQRVTLRYKAKHRQHFSALFDDLCEHKETRLPKLSHLHFQLLEIQQIEFYGHLDLFGDPAPFPGCRDSFPDTDEISLFTSSEIERCFKIGVTLTSDYYKLKVPP